MYEIGRFHTFVQPEHPEWSYYWIMLAKFQLRYWLLALIATVYFVFKKKYERN
jgi:hypothetical protein